MDAKLINEIVEQVLKALGSTAPQGAGTPASGVNPVTGVRSALDVKPASGVSAPSGVNPSVVGLPSFVPVRKYVAPVSKEWSGTWGARSTPKSAPKPPAKIFVTAEMLLARLAGADAGAVELAHNEFLTPNAEDLADRKHITIKKTAAKTVSSVSDVSSQLPRADAIAGAKPQAVQAAKAQAPATACGSSSVGLVVERADAKVDSLLGALNRDGLALVNFTQTDCWRQNLAALCRAIQGGQVCCGVAVVPYAAGAMVLAGKFKNVAPVQGTRADSVAAALRHYGANLLVLEHAFSTYHEMRSMVQWFAARGGEVGIDKSLVAMIRAQEKA